MNGREGRGKEGGGKDEASMRTYRVGDEMHLGVALVPEERVYSEMKGARRVKGGKGGIQCEERKKKET
jgi:hypothetical protein